MANKVSTRCKQCNAYGCDVDTNKICEFCNGTGWALPYTGGSCSLCRDEGFVETDDYSDVVPCPYICERMRYEIEARIQLLHHVKGITMDSQLDKVQWLMLSRAA
jgi:hypothetical protein